MRPGKHVLVWAAALMMIANPASACRWRARSFGGSWGGDCGTYSSAYYGGDCTGYVESGCGGYVSGDCGVAYDSGCDSGCGTTVEAGCSGCEVSGEGVTTDTLPEGVPVEAETPQPTFESDVPAATVEPAPVVPSTPPAAPPAAPPAPTPKPQPAAPRSITPPPAPATRPAPAPAPAPAAPKPAAPAPAPAAQPEVEDLFSTPAPAATPTPETKPAEPAEVEDLFKDPEPAAPAPQQPSDNVDDLFKDLDEGNENKAAASESPAEKATEGELEDLFSEPKPTEPMATVAPAAAPAVVAAEPSQPASMRLWTDNTGKYQVRGKLVMVGKTHIRLLKENGKFTTVPYGRLSQTDLAFVRSQTDPALVASF